MLINSKIEDKEYEDDCFLGILESFKESFFGNESFENECFSYANLKLQSHHGNNDLSFRQSLGINTLKAIFAESSEKERLSKA